MNPFAKHIANALSISEHQVEATLKLLDEGCTIPFIARYRKERTGNLDEVQITRISELNAQLKELEKRKATILKTIAEQEKLNDAFVLNASIGKVIYINRKVSLNLNLNVDNILNNRKIMTYGYQQGRFDYTNYSTTKYPNRYFYAQGIKVFFNVGVRF